MIITKTPFRMSFFGGGTDMESFFRENGGAVLSTTFDKYCYVNVRHLPRFFDYSTELSYSKTERVTNIDDIQHPAIRNAMKMLDIAYSAGSLINLITGAINSTFAPYQYQKIKAGEYELLAKRANQILLFVGVMLAGIMLFSREIVLVFGGTKYIDSVGVIIPICIGVFSGFHEYVGSDS